MEQLVADASVIVKFFINERYTEDALRLRDAVIAQGVSLNEPSLLEYEVINGVRSSKARKFSLVELKTVIESLLNYNFTTLYLDKALATRAAELSEKHAITFYDAAYLSIATSLGVKMYTADEKLIEKVGLPALIHISDFK